MRFPKPRKNTATEAAAAASAKKSASSALRPATKSWRISSTAPKPITATVTASGARASVPSQSSAAMAAYTTKCSTLSQGASMWCGPAVSTASASATAATRQAKRSVGILCPQDDDDGLQD